MQPFVLAHHVFTDEIDYSGVVYHANFLIYLEHGRTAMARQLGWGLDKLAAQKIYFVIRNINIEYLIPARLHDDLEIITEIEKIGRTSLTFKQAVRFAKHPEKILCNASVVVVCIDATLKPRVLPNELITAFNEKGIKQ